MSLIFTVHGTPAPQGSKRAFNHNGRVVMIESGHERVRTWREDVKQAALKEMSERGAETYTGPVAVEVRFYLPRLKAHYRTGKNAHLLRDDAPLYVAKKPDIDKLLRATLDALTAAGVWADDSQVAKVTATKTYLELAGADIIVDPLPGGAA